MTVSNYVTWKLLTKIVCNEILVSVLIKYWNLFLVVWNI